MKKLINPTKAYCESYLKFLKSIGITQIIGNPLDEHSSCQMTINISKITNKELLNELFEEKK